LEIAFMDTQFGLAHVWSQGDWVTRTVALILLGMSLASWLVILIKALDLRTHRAQAKGAEAFWHAADFEEGLAKLGTEANNPFRQLAETGREATRHIQRQDDPLARPGKRSRSLLARR
jgi:biopolymer transport protein ExbB